MSLDSVWPVACNMLIPLKLQAHYREKHPEIRAIEHIPERIERYEHDERTNDRTPPDYAGRI